MTGKTRARRAEPSRPVPDRRGIPTLLDDRALSVPIYGAEDARPSLGPPSNASDAPNGRASPQKRPRTRP